MGSQASYCLGDISVDHAQVKILFETFFGKYHHFLPFLDPSRTAKDYYERSDVLFWTIIAVASRQHRSDTQLATKLYTRLHEMLWAAIASPSIHLATIQAIVLICNWPMTAVRISTDVSTSLIDIACSIAKQLGLHRPGCERDFDFTGTVFTENDLSERICTWVACAVTAQCQAGNHGFEPSISLQGSTLAQICDGTFPTPVPSELRHHLVIRKFCNKLSSHLANNPLDPLGLPTEDDLSRLFSRFEDERETLSSLLRGQLSFANTMRLLDAEICLHGLWLLSHSDQTARRAGLLKAYSSATSLISYTVNNEASNVVLPFAPLSFFRIFFGAASILWKLLNSDLSQNLDSSHGKTLYDAAGFAMRQMSSAEGDVPIRASRGLALLWHLGERDLEMRQKPPTLNVLSRTTANLPFDCLLQIRDFKKTLKTRNLHEHFEMLGGPAHLDPAQNNDAVFKEACRSVQRNTIHTSLDLRDPLSKENTSTDHGLGDNLPDIDWLWSSDYPTFDDF